MRGPAERLRGRRRSIWLCVRSDRFGGSQRLRLSRTRLANVDAALEEGSIFDGDARGDHVAGQRTFAADVDAIARVHVSAHLAQYHYLTRHDVGRDLAVAT